jgi:23S rRNA (guanosine2251-2'-O)-methyltransferase
LSESTDRGGSSGEPLAGRRPVLELLRSGGKADRVLIAQGLAPSNVIGEIRKLADAAGIPIRMVPRDEIERRSDGQNHQGVLAITGRFRYTPIEKLFGDRARLLFLDGISDPHNLGSLLRTAECAGFDGVVIPAHRAAPVTPAVRRVAAGAAELMPVARVTNLGRALDQAREAGLWIVGLDEKAEADLWTSDLLEPPLGLVLGSEGKGLGKNIADRVDGFVRIPQAGRIGSLNVGVAGALAMFEVARRSSSGEG